MATVVAVDEEEDEVALVFWRLLPAGWLPMAGPMDDMFEEVWDMFEEVRNMFEENMFLEVLVWNFLTVKGAHC